MSAKLGVEIIPTATARETVTGADVVMCATNSMEPIFPAEWLEPGMHVSSLKRLELDASVVAGADVTFIHMRDAGSKTIRSAGAELSSDTEEKKVALSGKIGARYHPVPQLYRRGIPIRCDRACYLYEGARARPWAANRHGSADKRLAVIDDAIKSFGQRRMPFAGRRPCVLSGRGQPDASASWRALPRWV
jgi:hypothetical protein